MQQHERQLIEGLFQRLRAAESQSRDPEVERLIADELRRSPHAPYAMAQTIIAQNKALEAAAARIDALEQGRDEDEDGDEDEGSVRMPGALGAPQLGRRGSVPQFGGAAGMQQGGGFLANAVQIALGVAGGMLIGEAAKSLLGTGSEAQAATSAADTGTADTAPAADNQLAEDAGINDVGSEASGGGDGGGLFGWLFGGGSPDSSGDGGHDFAGSDSNWDSGGDFGGD